MVQGLYNKVFCFVRGKCLKSPFLFNESPKFNLKKFGRFACQTLNIRTRKRSQILKCKLTKALFISVDAEELYSARLGKMWAIKFSRRLFGSVANSRSQRPCRQKHAWFSRSQNTLHLIKTVLRYFSYFHFPVRQVNGKK